MSTINVTIDVSKIDKTKLKKVEWTDQEGNKKSKNNLEIQVMPLKSGPAVCTNKEGVPVEGVNEQGAWMMMKTHVVKQKGEKGEELPWLGEGITFQSKAGQEMANQLKENAGIKKQDPLDNFGDDIKPEDVPF